MLVCQRALLTCYFIGLGVLGVYQFKSEIFDWLTYITRCVDLRTGAFDVPPQEILTRDSVTVSVDAVVYYQVSLGTLHSHQGISYHLIYIFWVSEVPPPPLVVLRSLFLSMHQIISTMKYENMFLSSLFFKVLQYARFCCDRAITVSQTV